MKTESITGRSLKAILAALPEFEKAKLDVTKYNVDVSEWMGDLYVTLSDPNKPDDTRFHQPSLTEYQVWMDPVTLVVRGSGLSK